MQYVTGIYGLISQKIIFKGFKGVFKNGYFKI